MFNRRAESHHYFRVVQGRGGGVRTSSLMTASAVAAGLMLLFLLPKMAFSSSASEGGTEAAAASRGTHDEGSGKHESCAGRTTVICHRQGNAKCGTIAVCEEAVAAHEAHGDTVGECPTEEGEGGARCDDRSDSDGSEPGSCDGDSDSDNSCGVGTNSCEDDDSDNRCAAGNGKLVSNASPCQTNAECDDGDRCNGVETCHAGCCRPGTPLVCDDGLYCNGPETCDPETGCQAATPISCDDGVDCTVDSCNEALDVCLHVPDNVRCADGDQCNGVELCDTVHGCMAGSVLACDDGEYCNGLETCDPASGCRSGTPPCDDAVACTVDACNERKQTCDHTAVDARCDDGLSCNGEETCDPTLGCQSIGSQIDCGVLDSVCGVGTCEESVGGCIVEPINEGVVCDDGDDLCTLQDRCADGQCVGTPLCDAECERCDVGNCISLCGNPFDSSNDEIRVVDALFALRASVALESCPLCVCDVNSDGVIGTTDALRLLRRAVRLPVALDCPPSASNVTTTTTLPVTSTTLGD